MPTRWFDQAYAVLCKDVLLEARSRVNLNAMVFFAGMMLLIFGFALGPDVGRQRDVAAGLLWLAFLFAGILAFGRAFQLERENNAFEGLLLVTCSRSALYVGKMLGTMVVMLLVEIVVVPSMAVLYNLDLWMSIPALISLMLLGSLGLAALGTLYGSLTMGLRTREVLLPLLLLPAAVPVLLSAVRATSAALGGDVASFVTWLELLAAFDVIFVTVGVLTFEFTPGD